MDDKAKFHNTQSKLERYLYEYKNSYPKNIWHLISADFPLITLIITIVVIIELIGITLFSILLIITLALPYFYVYFRKSGRLWQRLLSKRKSFKAHHQELINKIKQVETDELKTYPDVKNYLENYNSEVEKETIRKDSIKKRYTILMIFSIIVFIGFCVITFNADTRLNRIKSMKTAAKSATETLTADSITNVYYNGEYFNYLKLTPNTPVASIKPMPSILGSIITVEKPCNIDLYFVEGKQPFLRTIMPPFSSNASIKDSCVIRITITDSIGTPIYGIPFFDFVYSYHLKQNNRKIIESYPIVTPLENHPLEIARRMQYLQQNSGKLKYMVEEI